MSNLNTSNNAENHLHPIAVDITFKNSDCDDSFTLRADYTLQEHFDNLHIEDTKVSIEEFDLHLDAMNIEVVVSYDKNDAREILAYMGQHDMLRDGGDKTKLVPFFVNPLTPYFSKFSQISIGDTGYYVNYNEKTDTIFFCTIPEQWIEEAQVIKSKQFLDLLKEQMYSAGKSIVITSNETSLAYTPLKQVLKYQQFEASGKKEEQQTIITADAISKVIKRDENLWTVFCEHSKSFISITFLGN
jgi:hypothetical protein